MYARQIWLAATHLEQFERCQSHAIRVITGQLQTILVETLRREVGVRSMSTLMRWQIVMT